MGDLREELEAAMAGESLEVEETVETEEQQLRGEDGKFKAKDDEPADVVEASADTIITPEETPTESPAEPVVEPEKTALAPPNGWTSEAKANWHELPEHIQAVVNQRELDVHKQISKHDDERNFGRELGKVIQPYMAQITADGGNPAGTVQNLLNTAYTLRTGSPEQRKQALLGVAQEFGVDLTNIETTQVQPEYAALQNRLNTLEGQITTREHDEQNRLKTEVQQEVDAFAADATHPHYEQVKGAMSALIASNATLDLQGAYDQACWASPDVRATLLATQRSEEEQKRKADAKEKVENARKAGVSITGGPGGNISPAPEDMNLREQLEAQFAAQSSAV